MKMKSLWAIVCLDSGKYLSVTTTREDARMARKDMRKHPEYKQYKNTKVCKMKFDKFVR